MCFYNVMLFYYIVYNWEREIFELGLVYNLWNWIVRDINGVIFVYYVCCVGNRDMIDLLERNGVIFDERFFNGFIFLYFVVICR